MPAKLSLYPRWTALALGAVAATGFQPLNLWPLTLLALAGLVELIARAASWKRAAMLGWLFGVGHFTLGNNWIATAFTYQANMPKWLGWVAVFLLALYLAVYPLLAALGSWCIARRRDPQDARRVPLIVAFAGCWIVAEWLRSWVFTGYAWNPLGMVALGGFARPGLASLTPWLGTYGLSGLVVLFGGLWPLALRHGLPRFYPEMQRAHAGIGFRYIPMKLAGAGLLVALPITVWMIGLDWTTDRREGALPYTLIQPDIRQEDLDNPALFEQQFARTARLTIPRDLAARLVLWPESGVPDYLRAGYPSYFYRQMTFAADPLLARRRIGRVIGPGSMLMTGAVDLEMRAGDVAAARNVVTAIDERGAIRGSYAKAHLVPYGEYLPMRPVLEPLGLTRLVPGALDFWPGPGPRTLDLGPWGKAGVQICYEIVFSGQVVDRAHRPDYLFNPSNDGWFGDFGPPQHLAQARMRAIEEGLPVLRATTTGISAVIDADGVVRRALPRHVAGRIDGLVPPAHAPTLFARTGNMLPLGWAAVLLVATLIAMRRRQR